MRLSVITLAICLIGAISANPHPTGGSGSESVSESESCGNGLDCESNDMYSNSGGKAKVPKGDSFKYKETTKSSSQSSDIKGRIDVLPEYSHNPKEALQRSLKLFYIKKNLIIPKGDDFSSDRSLVSKSTSSELSNQDPNAQEDGEVDPTTSSDMFEEIPLPDFLVFDYPSAPTRDQQMIAYDIFLSIYNYTGHSDLLYTFGKIREPESKKTNKRIWYHI
ncbi:hypothetical protein BASA60_002914 [Batrachochytrium salamandrivorans]|nr:hypothetical protein BASA60_002914 [Batrachochytrium salamandrivorans]